MSHLSFANPKTHPPSSLAKQPPWFNSFLMCLLTLRGLPLKWLLVVGAHAPLLLCERMRHCFYAWRLCTLVALSQRTVCVCFCCLLLFVPKNVLCR